MKTASPTIFASKEIEGLAVFMRFAEQTHEGFRRNSEWFFEWHKKDRK